MWYPAAAGIERVAPTSAYARDMPTPRGLPPWNCRSYNRERVVPVSDALGRFERLIESVVGSIVGRATNLKLHPIEVAKRLGAVMDAEEVIGIGGKVAPNVYVVQMSIDDFAAFGGATV